MFWGVQSFELTLLFKILLHLVWLRWLHWNNWLHFPSSLAFVTLSGCSSGFSLNGVLLTLIFLTLEIVKARWWSFRISGQSDSSSWHLSLWWRCFRTPCCTGPQTSVCMFNHFFFFFLSLCVYHCWEHLPAPKAETCDSSLQLLFSDYGVVLETCFPFCVCSISFPPERSETCTDCHRIHL